MTMRNSMQPKKTPHRVLAVIIAAASVGVCWPAHAFDGTSLVDCLRGGGHSSGKYCSGGSHDGKLIVT